MSEQEKTAEEELKDKVWQIAGRVVIAGFLIGVGYVGAYLQYGDAPALRQENKQQNDRVVDLENERETLSTRMAKETRDREVCEKELKVCKDAAKNAASAQ